MVRQISPTCIHIADLDLGVAIQINQRGRVARVGLFVVLTVDGTGRVLPSVDHDAEATVDRLVHVGDLSIHKEQSGVVDGQYAPLVQPEQAGIEGVPVGLVGRMPQPARVVRGTVFVDVRMVLDQVQRGDAGSRSGFAHQATDSLDRGLAGFHVRSRILDDLLVFVLPVGNHDPTVTVVGRSRRLGRIIRSKLVGLQVLDEFFASTKLISPHVGRSVGLGGGGMTCMMLVLPSVSGMSTDVSGWTGV